MVSGGKVIPGQLYLPTSSCKYGYLKEKKMVLSLTDLVSATKDLFTLLIIKVLLLDVSFIWCPNYSLSHDRDRTEKLTH